MHDLKYLMIHISAFIMKLIKKNPLKCNRCYSKKRPLKKFLKQKNNIYKKIVLKKHFERAIT